MTIKIMADTGTRDVVLTVTEGEDQQTESIGLWGQGHVRIPAVAGRVAYTDVGIPSGVEQSDGSYALVLRALRNADVQTLPHPTDAARTVALDIRRSVQLAGWSEGDWYMLETDPATGDLIVEPGRNHRKIYVSASPAAYTAAMIAAEAGVSVGTVTTAWLTDRPDWGGSPEKALVASLGINIWKGTIAQGGSNWLLFERGYDYAGISCWPPAVTSESALHPTYVGAWGAGSAPTNILYESNGGYSGHQVLNGIHKVNLRSLDCHNWLIADVENSDYKLGYSGDHTSKRAVGLTLYRTAIMDACEPRPDATNGVRDVWNAHADRESGGYIAGVSGLLVLDTFWDHNGWEDGYHPDGLTWNNGEFGQPPTLYSHNLYTQWTNRDVGFIGMFNSRGPAHGSQLRAGGYHDQCFYLDNDVVNSSLGGNYDENGYNGHYGLQTYVTATSAGYKFTPDNQARVWGFGESSRFGAMVGCLICHKADPNNPAEIAFKTVNHSAIRRNSTYPLVYNDTIVYGWNGSNENTSAVDPEVMDATTIQNRGGDLLGQPSATIPDYLEVVRAMTPQQRVAETRNVLDYFRRGAGMRALREIPAELTFKPDWRGEGFRWENVLNWGDGFVDAVPGFQAGDTASLHGNRVKFGPRTRTVAEIEFGGGVLEVSSGKLVALSHADAAQVEVYNSGQYFAPANADGDYSVRGGRLAYGGSAAVDLAVSGDAECLFGSALTIASGKTLRVDGGLCFAGWDGDGSPTLTIGSGGTLDLRSTLALTIANLTQLYTRDFSGWPMLGGTSGFTGRLDMVRYSGSGFVGHIRDLIGTPVVGETATDKMVQVPATSYVKNPDGYGAFVDAPQPTVSAIGARSLPQIRRFKRRGDAPTPTCTPTIALASGSIVLVDAANWPTGSHYLTGEGVTVTDNGATLPAGVTVAGGRLVLTV